MLSEEQWTQVGDGIKAGHYNLLVGAGVSLDSKSSIFDNEGLVTYKELPSGKGLAAELAAALPGVNADSSLSRLKKAMTPEQVDRLITKRFAGCIPGPTVEALAAFRWKRVFTLNIDDALERAYETRPSPVQALKSYTHKAVYESVRDLRLLPVMHLHGWAKEPEDGYVFDLSEYAHNMARNNVWAHVLSELIRSEPFIVIGTLFEEPDLSFFLAQREEITQRRDAPPSILIEPFADDATRVDCSTYKLSLFKGFALDFLGEVSRRFPVRPSVADAIEHNLGDISLLPIDPIKLAEFNADFERVPTDLGADQDGGPNFAYGHQATWADIQNGRDVDRPETGKIQGQIVTEGKSRVVVVGGGPGTGKSTTLRRVALSLARAGSPCLLARSIGRIRVASAVAVLEHIKGRRYVFVDNLADNAVEVVDLRNRLRDHDVVFVGAERDYRLGHIERVLGKGVIKPISLGAVGSDMARALVSAYQGLGLAAPRNADPIKLSLADEFVAVACCRILNDFEPLTQIIDKSLSHHPQDVDCYIFAALAAYCYRSGIELDVISCRFPDYKVELQIEANGPLPLKSETVFDVELVTPANEAVSTTILGRFANREPTRMLSTFISIAAAIAPRVNLRTIAAGEPCARIASRLFDYDEVVKPLLGREAANDFYDATKRSWAWNSRYWHQRAQHRLDIAAAATDPIERRESADMAVKHARFAGTIEAQHPFTKTTIGRMLFGRMDVLGTISAIDLTEAIEALGTAIAIERARFRPTVHPFMTLFAGVSRAIEVGAVLSPDQRQTIRLHVDRALNEFPNDPDMRDQAMQLRRAL